MYISKFQVSNFKSYRDSIDVEFKPGFNIITGQNNAGKTALLEALTLQFLPKPHRSVRTVPVPGAQPQNRSTVRAILVLSGKELLHSIQSMGDAESQLKTAGGVTHAYDGDGRRAAKVGSKLYWYGSGGEVLAETDASGNLQNEYVFFDKRRIAVVPASGSALYYAEDFLGSSRVIVQSDGTLCYDADFVPFGAERLYTSTCSQNYKFEGKERDSETQNDDFGAREYSWRFGRWLSSDWSAVPVPVPYANLSNPQTLNLYAMVADDPESFEDLDGHGFWEVFSEFSAGLQNALVSDNLAGIGRQEQTTTAGHAGAIVGDTLATLQGAGEATTGGTLVAAGAAACSTGAGCVVGAPAIGIGSLAAVHGATTAAEGTGHLLVAALKIAEGTANSGGESAKPSLSDHKEALKEVHEKVGKLPKGEPGKFGSPQRGTPKKGYRLDPGHPNSPHATERGPHINYWDYTRGKRGAGGISGAVPIPPQD
jgi:RHS repeat-associated protein